MPNYAFFLTAHINSSISTPNGVFSLLQRRCRVNALKHHSTPEAVHGQKSFQLGVKGKDEILGVTGNVCTPPPEANGGAAGGRSFRLTGGGGAWWVWLCVWEPRAQLDCITVQGPEGSKVTPGLQKESRLDYQARHLCARRPSEG